MDRTTGDKTDKEREDTNSTVIQPDLTDIYGTPLRPPAEHTFFRNARGTHSRKEHMLCHETSLNMFNRTEMMHSMFSNHNRMSSEINNNNRREINNRKTLGKCISV